MRFVENLPSVKVNVHMTWVQLHYEPEIRQNGSPESVVVERHHGAVLITVARVSVVPCSNKRQLSIVK